MKKRFLTLAAAAAMTCTGVCFADNPGSGSISTGLKNAGSEVRAAAGTATNDMKQAGDWAMSETQLRDALNTANDPGKLFLVCAAIDNNCETQMADLAQQKAQDPKVKEIAQRIIQDHQQAQQQLQQAAQAVGVTLPKGVPAIKQQEKRVMESLSGKDFDQHYLCMIQAGHAKAVREYQDMAQLAKNDQVKQYASKTLPSIQQHLQDIQQAAVALGLPSSNEAQPAGAKMNSDLGTNNMPKTPGR